MKKIIGGIMFVIWALLTIYSFIEAWGALGFIASLMFMPMAMIWTALASILAGGWDLIVTVVWIGLASWLCFGDA